MKTFTATLFILLASLTLMAQKEQSHQTIPNKHPLDGLKKAEKGDIEPGTPLMLNPMEFPMFLEDSTLLAGNDFMKLMMSNEYVPEPYLDSTKKIKAFVMRKATEEEKAFIRQMQNSSSMDIPIEKNLEGQKAPDFDLKDLNGTPYSNKTLKGKVTVINFWFIECKPCVLEIPDLNQLTEKYKGKNVEFLGIATNNETRLKDFLAKTPFLYRIIPNGMKTATDFGVGAYPTHLILDQNSNVSYMSVGVGPETIKSIESTIETLLKKP
ncbi:MAG: TlpA family protein disulfide reductase [Bacteroidota bacterium]